MSKNDRVIPLRVILKLIILMAVLFKVNSGFIQQKNTREIVGIQHFFNRKSTIF